MDKKSRELVMGKLYLKNKDYKMAEKSLHDYLNANPEDFQALKLLAQVYEHLRNFPKAFDLYERCYLVEPDRKGVLLDICRLLLMNDTSLAHVDQKKWLKLAIQTFPSNAIVVNLRESLPLNIQDPSPSKNSLESEILSAIGRVEKKLEEIGSFEQRLQNIELKLESLSIKQAEQVQAKPPPPAVTTPARSADPRINAATPPQVVTPKPAVQEKIESPAFPSFTPGIFSKPASATTPVSVQTVPPAATNSFFTSTFSSLSFSSPSSNKPLSGPEKKEISLAPAPTTTPFGFNSPFSLSSNLFNSAPKPTSSSTFEFLGKPSSSTEREEEKPNNTAEQGNSAEDDDGDVVKTEELPIENTCDMKPIEIKSGEEDEDAVFEQRCKLFRFRDNEYKERGLGNLKVMKHKTTGKGRLVMRRELVNLVCLNCWSCSKIERVRDTQVRFAGLDASDGEPEMTVFVVKFKTEELTDTFMKHLNELFSEE